MISFLFVVLMIMLLWAGCKVTGTLLLAFIWLFIKLPLAIVALVLGVVFCCTLILIPLGLVFFKMSIALIVPGI